MWAQLHELGLLAAQSPGPRGDNPSDLGGILIVVGIVAAVVLVAVVAFLVLPRSRRARGDASRRRPHEPGRVGRIWEFRARR
jgi:hypothetical protein